MSSSRANPCSLRDPRRQNARATDRIVGRPVTKIVSAAPKRRGRRQPQADDFQVTCEMPQPLPILDKELRAIEILLGNELLDLLSNDAKDS